MSSSEDGPRPHGDPVYDHSGEQPATRQDDDAHGQADEDAKKDKPQSKLSPRAKLILIVLAVVVAIGVLVWFVHHELRGKYLQDTNDAQIEADAVTVAPRVNGYVAEVMVADNQDVRAGQPLVRIDPRDYRATAAKANAQIAQAEASTDSARAAIQEQYATVDQSRAQLAQAQAKAALDAAQVARYAPLVAAGAEKQEQLDQLRATARQSADQARAQAATLAGQQRHVASLQAQLRESQAQTEGARAQLASADVDVGATLIRAAINGRVGSKTVTLGQYTQAGTRLMSIVPLDKIYVVANFKETQLALMRIGQPATITVDALSGTDIHGRVESVSPGTGAKFSLIPPSNATGNFTKIVQRVPVRIAIDASPDARKLLVPGLSVTVTVDTIAAKDQLTRIKDEQDQHNQRAQ